MYTRVDIILWVFLQNSILLPYEYLIETEEYEIFRSASFHSSKFIISNKDVFDDTRIDISDFYFDSFDTMISLLNIILPENHRKKILLERAIPILEGIRITNMLENCHF